jgi:hypothetical protein
MSTGLPGHHGAGKGRCPGWQRRLFGERIACRPQVEPAVQARAVLRDRGDRFDRKLEAANPQMVANGQGPDVPWVELGLVHPQRRVAADATHANAIPLREHMGVLPGYQSQRIRQHQPAIVGAADGETLWRQRERRRVGLGGTGSAGDTQCDHGGV